MKKLKKQIESIDGVISCRLTGKDNLNEVHIISDDTRMPKRIVRDIETIVLVETGDELNHKKISIASLNNYSDSNNERAIELISLYHENNRPICNYKFKIGNELKNESIKGSNVEGIAWLSAKGMIEVIEKYELINGSIQMENVCLTGKDNNAVLVEIQVFLGRNFQSGQKLLGSVYINNNLPLAAAKAALKALNRQINYSEQL